MSTSRRAGERQSWFLLSDDRNENPPDEDLLPLGLQFGGLIWTLDLLLLCGCCCCCGCSVLSMAARVSDVLPVFAVKCSCAGQKCDVF